MINLMRDAEQLAFAANPHFTDAEKDELFEALWPSSNPSSSSTSPAPVDAHGNADKAKPSRIYPTGAVKEHKTPDCLKKLNCPNGSLNLDSKAHRFVANLASNTRDVTNQKLVAPFIQGSKSSNFDKNTVKDWQTSLKDCHFWMWTRYGRINPNRPCQIAGQIPADILDELAPIIQQLPDKVEYGKKVRQCQSMQNHAIDGIMLGGGQGGVAGVCMFSVGACVLGLW
jgi:hypothetical protein